MNEEKDSPKAEDNCATLLVTLTAEQQLVDIKKKICDPPAARFAASGDPVVAGLFEGAGPASDAISDPVLQAWFRTEILAIEDAYMAERASCADGAKARVMAVYESLAAKIGG